MLKSGRFHRLFLGALIALSVLFSIIVLWDIIPLIRGPEAWRWWLLPMPPFGKIVLTTAALLLFLAGWWILRRRLQGKPAKKQLWISLLILAVLSFILQIAFLSIYRDNPIAILFERLASDQASGYFTVAAEIDHLPDFLKEYPERMPNFRPDPHPRSKPPGIVLLYWGATRLMEKLPAVSEPVGHWARGIRCADLWLVNQSDAALAGNVFVGLFTVITSILAVFPIYTLAARRWGLKAGWLAAGLVALMPGRILFAPHLDTVYPFLTLLALFFLDTAVRRDHVLLTVVSGLILSLATFFSLVNALAAALVGFYLLLIFLPERRWRPMIRHALALAAGALSIWLLYWLYSGVTPFDIYIAARPARHDLTRSYWLWLFGNIYDFAIFAGLPVFLMAVYYTVAQITNRKIAPLALAFWSVLLLLDLSGVIRAETGRIWLMLAPLPALLAAQHTNQPNSQFTIHNSLFKIHYSLFLLTAFSLWTISLRWEVTRLEWPPPTERTIQNTLPNRPLTNTPFGPNIQLAAYEMELEDKLLTTTLYWQTLSRPDTPYTVFLHVIDEAGNISAQQDIMPQNGRLPTTCWQPQEVITDAHQIDLTALEPGNYQVVIGLYHQKSAARLGETILEPSITLLE